MSPICQVLAPALLAASLVTGCAFAPLPPTDPETVRVRHEQLQAGIKQYERGEFIGAIRTLLASAPIWNGPVEDRVTAHKYVAFSQCVLDRPISCRESFESLLKLDPSFELAPAEAGHPQWGTAFRRARKAVLAQMGDQSTARGEPVLRSR